MKLNHSETHLVIFTVATTLEGLMQPRRGMLDAITDKVLQVIEHYPADSWDTFYKEMKEMIEKEIEEEE